MPNRKWKIDPLKHEPVRTKNGGVIQTKSGPLVTRITQEKWKKQLGNELRKDAEEFNKQMDMIRKGLLKAKGDLDKKNQESKKRDPRYQL